MNTVISRRLVCLTACGKVIENPEGQGNVRGGHCPVWFRFNADISPERG